MSIKKILFKRATFMVLLLWLFLTAAAQTQVEIHQINVGNGDGAVIMLWDNNKLRYTIVIDGGLKSGGNDFIPYLKNVLPDDPAHGNKKRVDWVILSHNHQDHFNGLIELFKDPAFLVREITDQGGYITSKGVYTMPLPEATTTNCVPFITRTKKNKTKPQQALVDYVAAVRTADLRTRVYFDSITREKAFDTTTKEFLYIPLPSVGGIPVEMDCIATNAFTDGKAGRDIGGKNPNNFSFGWVLRYGEFRFYSGGDLGGYTGGYTDQETPMAAYLTNEYPTNYPMTGSRTATNYPGHVCVMKTDHHGSTESSRPEFLQTLAPSAIVTSAGQHKRWKIPTVPFVRRVAATPAFDSVRGVYFTQLYNYPNNKSLTEANSKFKTKTTYNYVEPGPTSANQYSYKFVIKPSTVYARMPQKPDTTIDIKTCSIYTVYKIRTSDNQQTAQAVYLCHKP